MKSSSQITGKVMKIYTLMDNESCLLDYNHEHGLSLYIETKYHKILFDFGQTDYFISNAM